MPDYIVDTADPATVKRWCETTEVEVAAKTPLLDIAAGLTSKKAGSPFREFDDDFTKPGDQVTTTFLRQLGGGPQDGPPVVIEGTGEVQSHFTDKFTIGWQRKTAQMREVLSQQRVSWNDAAETQEALTNKAIGFKEEAMMMQLCCYNAPATPQYYTNENTFPDGTSLPWIGHNAISDPDAKHMYRPGGVATDTDVAADPSLKFDLRHVDEMLKRNKALAVPIRPANIFGGKYYLMPLHSSMVNDLRADGTQWGSLIVSAIQGGFWKGNPLIEPKLYKYNNVIFFETDLCSPGVVSAVAVAKTRRTALIGQNALCMAYGMRMRENKYEYSFVKMNHGAQIEVAVSTLWGCHAVRYDSKLHGFMVATFYTDDSVFSLT